MTEIFQLQTYCSIATATKMYEKAIIYDGNISATNLLWY